jgi:hypothetical protein
MLDSLRDQLNKISLMESDDLEFLNNHVMDGDEGAADDELYDDIEESDEEDELDDIDSGESLNEAIDMIVNEMLLNESEDFDDLDDYDYLDEGDDCDDVFDDDYDDDDFDDDDDEVDMDYGVVGDGKSVKGTPDDDEYDEVDIGGVTNAIHGDVDLKEDIDDDLEDELDALLENTVSCPNCGQTACDCSLRATSNDIFGDSAELKHNTPPAPQYSKMYARNKVGAPIGNYGEGNFGTYGKTKFDRQVLGQATIDDDEYDEEGNAYDGYASAGNIYDDDENEEFYGIRNQVSTKNLYGRHNINNINYAQLGDRFAGTGDALDESVEMFLRGLE